MKIINYLLNYFRPNIFAKNIENIDLSIFDNVNIKAVFCDLDNTLVPHFTKYPTKSALNFCKEIQKKNKLFIVVSNNTKKRVSSFCNLLNPNDFVYSSKKPFLTKIKKILKKYNLTPDEIIFIGDQFIFDIFVANRLKSKSILTLPIVSSSIETRNKFLNFIEKFIYKKLEHNNIIINNTSKNIENEIL